MSSIKKRAADVAADKAEKPKKAAKKEVAPKKKAKKEAAPKDEPRKKEEREDDNEIASQGDAEEGDKKEGAEEKKAPKKKGDGKKRQVIRFNPHGGRDYLDLPKYWKHHESLRNGLLKAQASVDEADKEGDAEASETASASVIRYQGLLRRLESRRADTVDQVKLASALLNGPASSLAEPLITKILAAFAQPDPAPKAAPAPDAAEEAPAAAAADAPANADDAPEEAQE